MQAPLGLLGRRGFPGTRPPGLQTIRAREFGLKSECHARCCAERNQAGGATGYWRRCWWKCPRKGWKRRSCPAPRRPPRAPLIWVKWPGTAGPATLRSSLARLQFAAEGLCCQLPSRSGSSALDAACAARRRRVCNGRSRPLGPKSLETGTVGGAARPRRRGAGGSRAGMIVRVSSAPCDPHRDASGLEPRLQSPKQGARGHLFTQSAPRARISCAKGENTTATKHKTGILLES